MVTTTALTNGSATNSGAEEKSHTMSGSQRTMLLHEDLPEKWPKKRKKGTRSTADGLMKRKIL
jgi:hypothetical protein